MTNMLPSSARFLDNASACSAMVEYSSSAEESWSLGAVLAFFFFLVREMEIAGRAGTAGGSGGALLLSSMLKEKEGEGGEGGKGERGKRQDLSMSINIVY